MHSSLWTHSRLLEETGNCSDQLIHGQGQRSSKVDPGEDLLTAGTLLGGFVFEVLTRQLQPLVSTILLKQSDRVGLLPVPVFFHTEHWVRKREEKANAGASIHTDCPQLNHDFHTASEDILA